MTTKLGKDEQIVREDTFTANLILFWPKADFSLTNKRVTGHTPNTFLGLIPLGKLQMAQPLKTVSSVISSTQFFFKRLLFGVILLGGGFALMGNVFILGLILAIFGLVSVLNCYTSTFVITNNAGDLQGYEISILEKSKVEDFVNEVNTAIAEL